MNYNLSIVAAFLFLLAAVAAERMSDRQVQKLTTRGGVLKAKLDELSVRADQSGIEKKKCQEAVAAAEEVRSRMTIQGDNTSLIQWFDTTARNGGLVLLAARAVPAERAAEAGAYQRIRMDVRINGPYLGLLKYVESIERASIPMVIDTLSLVGVRELPGTGDLVLNVSCLFPTSTEKSPRTDGLK